MTRTYRPLLTIKRGEATALEHLDPGTWAYFEPVLRVPSRDKDWTTGGWKKPLQKHLEDVVDRAEKAVGPHPVLLDFAPLGTEEFVSGLHPMQWFLDKCTSRHMNVRPLLRSTSSAAELLIAQGHDARTGVGAGVYVGQSDWETGAQAAGRTLVASIGISPSSLDIFVDAGPAPSTVSPAAVDAEVDALLVGQSFRSVTVGSAGFVNTSQVARGITSHPRTDLATWLSTHGLRAASAKPTVDFFDFAVENPWFASPEVNPAFISISAFFRYTTGATWILAKGKLFKGQGGSSLGGRAMVPPLTVLQSDPLFRDVTGTPTDDWIDAVVAGTENGGSPEAWRRWATQRHVVVTVKQVSSLA